MTKTRSYDTASQLTGMTYTLGGTQVGNLSYAYDNDGRRSSVTGSFARTGLPLAINTTAYNANNQLTTWGTANLFYDLNGNMTSDGTHSYAWDARNRLTQMDSGNTASFAYDTFGRRISKTVLSAQTGFLYDGANAVQELSGTTVTANSLSGGIDEAFQRTDSAGARSFLTDALGSTLALTDSTGTLQTQYTFEPFGNTTSTGSASTNSFAYTGRELDSTGLYYYRARYYNPQLQRFVSEDPIGFNGGINLYAYVQNSPSNFADSSGESIGVSPTEQLVNSSGEVVVSLTPGSGENGYLAFYTALLYLQQSTTANGIIQELEQSPTNYIVHVSDQYAEDTHGAGTPYINWNPHLGGCTKRSHRAESPALLLLHELVHALLMQRGLDPSDEEAVTQITNEVATELGEGVRNDYRDSAYIKNSPLPLPIPSGPLAGRNCGCR